MGNIRRALLEPMTMWLGEPSWMKEKNRTAFVMKEWENHLGKFNDNVLEAAYGYLRLNYRYAKWPDIADVLEAVSKCGVTQPVTSQAVSQPDLKREYYETVEMHQNVADAFLAQVEPELHERMRDRAIDYYLRQRLAEGKAAEVLLQCQEKGEDALDPLKKSMMRLLRTNVFDFLSQTGHLENFKKEIGL